MFANQQTDGVLTSSESVFLGSARGACRRLPSLTYGRGEDYWRIAPPGFRLALAVAAILMFSSVACTETYWNVASSDWSTASNWTAGLPTSSTDAYFYNGGVATVSQTGEMCGNLYLGSATLSGSIAMQSGGLAVHGNDQIGYAGTGGFTQSGGTHTISNTLYVGSGLGSSGTYNLNAGQLSAGSGESVGYSGTGAFSQIGGSNTISGTNLLYVGYNPGSVGTYSLSGSGNLSAPNESVGYWGSGTFAQAGGTNIVSGSNLSIGGNAGSNGIYSLSGSGLLTAPMMYLGYAAGTGSIGMTGGSLAVSTSASIGYSGLGTFTQSGGTSSFSGNLVYYSGLFLGYNSSSLGICNLSGGQMSAVFDGSEYVGYSGRGIFTQTGGTNTVGQGGIYLGYNPSSNGIYYLSGGLLSTESLGNEYIGQQGAGSFIQSGGTNLASNYLEVGSGTYSLSGGSLGGAVAVGEQRSGQGTFTQSGGTSTIRSLDIEYGGTYSLSGGLLSGSEGVGGDAGQGTFTQSGGTNNIASLTVLAISGSTATYNLTGGLLTAGSGVIEYVGYREQTRGTFTQSGGTNTAPTICLGYQVSGGTYSLNGGMLITAAISNPSLTGVFNFGGGTLQASGPLSTDSPMILTGSDGSATVDTAGYAVVFSGPLSGSGGLTKIDSGTLILSGTNTYSGGTNVEAGTLEILDRSALRSGTSLSVGADAVAIFGGAAVPQAATAVPEPGTLVLLAMAGMVAAVVSRRQHAGKKRQRFRFSWQSDPRPCRQSPPGGFLFFGALVACAASSARCDFPMPSAKVAGTVPVPSARCAPNVSQRLEFSSLR